MAHAVDLIQSLEQLTDDRPDLMAGDTVKDMTADAVESGQAAVDDAGMDAESEVDKMKDDLGAQMNEEMNKLP